MRTVQTAIEKLAIKRWAKEGYAPGWKPSPCGETRNGVNFVLRVGSLASEGCLGCVLGLVGGFEGMISGD